MKLYSKEWHAINALLSYLRCFGVVELVVAKYARYDNTAPQYLLKRQIEEVQEILDNAE